MHLEEMMLTDKGFKLVSDLIPNKDYLVTKSGKLVKFLGFKDTQNTEYDITISTGETLVLSGDTIIDVCNDTCINCVDVDMMCGIENATVKPTQTIDLKSRHKPGFNRNQCYTIGFRREFDKLIDINFTLLSIAQRKEFLAGLIDNGETVVTQDAIIVSNLSKDYQKIIIFIVRSLGYDVLLYNECIYIKPNTNNGLLPIRSVAKQRDVLILSNVTIYDTTIRITSIKDRPISPGVILDVDTNEPILVGYSLIPIIQKGEN